ncbi:MAG: CocE/NonD family hydrolase [Actinomycetota bacterium]
MKKWISLAITVAALMTNAAPAGAEDEPLLAWERAEEFLHFHNEAQTQDSACAFEMDLPPEGPVKDCAGLVDSFDGLSLSVRMLIPEDATEPLPTLLYLHGFNSNRGEFSPGTGNFGDAREQWGPNFNMESFAANGYAVVMPAARGMGGSCGPSPNTGTHFEPTLGQFEPQLETPHGPTWPGGPDPDFTCSRGWTHIAEPDYEIRDWQYLLGLLVDAGVADPDRLGVAGGSYGAGQAWLMATAEPWLTPGGDRTIGLAAAVPMWGWTSLQNLLTPNGRATDDPDGGRSLERPYGIVKESVVGAVFLGRDFTRFNDVDSTETHSYALGAFAFWHRGEPYDTPEGAALVAAHRDKSAFNAEDYFAGLEAGTAEPVPVFAVQGWNDAYVGAVEVLQMYRKLKAADPAYPISIFLGDLGHQTAPSFMGDVEVRDAWNARANAFLDAYVLRGGIDVPAEELASMSTECADSTSEVVTAADWDSIHPGLLTLKDESVIETHSGPPNTVEELPTDPIVHGRGCITQAPGFYESERDVKWPVPSGGFTLLGLPKLMADYELSGVDATVIAKLWDVDADGNRTLVTRGMYRLSLAGGDQQTGRLKFQLLGNHYRFAADHSIHLEISQTDRSYLRPDNFESTITYKDIKLELPTIEKVDNGENEIEDGGDVLTSL